MTEQRQCSPETVQDISPFVAGARVAIHSGDHYTALGYREDFVLKVHKTGRFTLRSNPAQQWSPSKPWGKSKNYWTGDHGWSGGGTLHIWDDANDAEIRATIDRRSRYEKFAKLKTALERISFSDLVTDELLDQFEIVVLSIKPIPEEKP